MAGGWRKSAIVKETYTPTEGMKVAAKRALRWKEEGKAKGAGTPVGWGRATDIVAGRAMSEDVVKRMYSFFSRHEVDKQGEDFKDTTNPSNGRIMWDAWGGDAGYSWSKTIVERLKKAEVRKGWRDSADKVPQHKFDIRLVDHYAPIIQDALSKYLASLPIRQVIEAFSSRFAKSAESDALFEQIRGMLGESGTDQDLRDALYSVLADGYTSGAWAAGEQLGVTGQITGGVGGVISNTDWDNWVPGDTDAALRVADGGLANLLADADITINDINGTTLDLIGNKIGNGLASGAAADDIARKIRDEVGGKYRAEMIARTESTRAMMVSTWDTYTSAGVTEWELSPSDNACDECLSAAAENPYKIDDIANRPPLHPFCRCATLPVIETMGAGMAGEGSNEDFGGNEFGVESDDLAEFGDALSVFDSFSETNYSSLPEIITPEELRIRQSEGIVWAAQNYAGNNYYLMNDLLRLGDEAWMAKFNLTIQDVADAYRPIEILSEALNGSVLSETSFVSRAVKDINWIEEGISGLSLQEQLDKLTSIVGATFRDSGFISTFSELENRSSWLGSKDYLMHILLPEGTRGATIGNIREAEFLLPPGAQFTLVGVLEQAGKIILNVVLTGQG